MMNFCLKICKRADLHTSKLKFEYIHYEAGSYDDACDYAQQYSKEHEGMMVYASQRKYGCTLPGRKFAWVPMARWYNGRLI